MKTMHWTIIRNDTQYRKALRRMDKIFNDTDAPGINDEFDLLSLLIRQYEEENFPIEEADPIQVIKMKMDYMDLKQKDLIAYFGSKSTVSKILSYQVPLTLRHIWMLHEKLDLPLELLAKPYRTRQWDLTKKFRKQVAGD